MQVFEAVGLADEIVDRCFTGTTSRLRGTDFSSLYMDICRLHQKAYPPNTQNLPLLDNLGQFHYRDGGEAHLNNPETMVYLQVRRLCVCWSVGRSVCSQCQRVEVS